MIIPYPWILELLAMKISNVKWIWLKDIDYFGFKVRNMSSRSPFFISTWLCMFFQFLLSASILKNTYGAKVQKMEERKSFHDSTTQSIVFFQFLTNDCEIKRPHPINCIYVRKKKYPALWVLLFFMFAWNRRWMQYACEIFWLINCN